MLDAATGTLIVMQNTQTIGEKLNTQLWRMAKLHLNYFQTLSSSNYWFIICATGRQSQESIKVTFSSDAKYHLRLSTSGYPITISPINLVRTFYFY